MAYLWKMPKLPQKQGFSEFELLLNSVKTMQGTAL